MNSTLHASYPHKEHNNTVVLAALGIVFGDIGTSPLYTLKECFGGMGDVPSTPENILGILSLIFWSLIVVISLKYVVFIMRSDNKGEGGIMSLMSLILQKAKIGHTLRYELLLLGLLGAALFYGDGIITPAISVLSAVEGLEIIKPDLDAYVIPVSLVILVGLFSLQKGGTAQIGGLFGPIMLVWFAAIGSVGIYSLAQSPEILLAVDPAYAIHFFVSHGFQGFLALSSVVLAITGGEALYADMGHFGRSPIQKAWFLLVLPALLFNYFGQGALLLRDPLAVQNPFYLLVPTDILGAMVILATLATIIASQAVISGAFSLTSQAMQLGFCPRFLIQHTSEEEKGQIYVPLVNWMLLFGVIGLLLFFRTSSNLAAAYGIAVTGTMLITTILAFIMVHYLWKWNPYVSIVTAFFFLTIDLSFFIANSFKIVEGGWVPLFIGAVIFLLLSTWKQGRDLLSKKLQEEAMPIEEFLVHLKEHPPQRVEGTAVFMTGNRSGVPIALLHNLKHNKVLHETVVIMTVITEPVPRVLSEKRREVQKLADSLFRICLHYGFKETPHIPRVLLSSSRELDIDLSDTTFFFSREMIIPSHHPRMGLWRTKLFISLSRNMTSMASYFRIPTNRVIELGTQVEI